MKNRVSSVSGSGSWQPTVTSSVLLPSNVWTHVAATYTSGTVRFYVNGELSDTIARTYTMGSNGQPVLFSHSTQAFNGWMDDVRLYPFILKPHEIRALTGMREYAYDAKGNLTDDKVWTQSYDYENRLTQATNNAVSVFYRYDSFGRLTERRTSGASVTTNRMYYAGWQLIAEYNGAGSLQAKYVYGPGIDEPVRMTRAATNYYYHPDGLGSVTEVTTNGGFKIESYTYDVYGAPTIKNAAGTVITSSAIANRLMFTARDRDPDTALYNYRFRYYSPTLGRFVQVDPILISGGDLNLYRYTGNNPANFVDPFGLFNWETVKSSFTVSGGLAGVGVGLKGKLGPARAGFHFGAANYASFNTKEGVTVKVTAAAEIFLGWGSYKAKIGPSYEKTTVKHGQGLNCPEVKTSPWNPAIERELGSGSIEASPWSIGVSVNPLIGTAGVNVDLKTLWQGLWE